MSHLLAPMESVTSKKNNNNSNKNNNFYTPTPWCSRRKTVGTIIGAAGNKTHMSRRVNFPVSSGVVLILLCERMSDEKNKKGDFRREKRLEDINVLE